MWACGPATLVAGCGGSPLGTLFADGGEDGTVRGDGGSDASTTGSHRDASRDARETDGGVEEGSRTEDASDGGSDVGSDAISADGPADVLVVEGGTMDAGADANGAHDAAPDGPAVCGNGILEGAEQCDDGNLFDLDGCDSACQYEMVTRVTSLQISGGQAPAFCSPRTNAFGTKVLTALALGELNPGLQTDVANGTQDTMLQFLGLSDLTGTTASGFSIGLANASPDPAKGALPATGNPIDWWFLADPLSVANGLPTSLLTGAAVAAHALTAGPSDVSLTFSIFGGNPIDFVATRLSATIATAPAPDVPAPPPAMLKAGLTTFQEITGSGAAQGICGNITVSSLAQAPVLKILTSGLLACTTPAYTYCGNGMPVGPSCNSMLDVFVGGCSVGPLAAVNATPPDVAGNGTVQPLALGANNKVTVPAGDTDAYSSHWTFNANRAHFTGESCATLADCQTGKTCSAGGACQ